MGPSGPTTPFRTTRGIRQGCPASPLLFAIYISFLERRLLRRCSQAGIHVGNHRILSISYADDITLLATTKQEALLLFAEIQQALAYIGLTTEASKCKILQVHTASSANRTLHSLSTDTADIVLPFQSVTQLRILGL